MPAEGKKPRVKKEKKPIQIVAVVTPNGIEGTFTPEPRKPLIVHLPFQSCEVEFSTGTEFRYDPNPPTQPEPYEDDNHLYFEVNQELNLDNNEGSEKDSWKIAPTPEAIRVQLNANHPITPEVNINEEAVKETTVEVKKEIQPIPKSAKLLVCYATKANETFQVPEKTDIRCFYCTNECPGSPFFRPVSLVNGQYNVVGNYCHVQCALSDILREKMDSHVRWEQVALLHSMYKAYGRIHPAPPRESLQIFGGPYTKEQFFQIMNDKKTRIDINQPPMVSILSTLDTKPVDFYDSLTQTSFTGGFSMDRFKAWSEQGGALRLKRSKPLKDKESTLDSILSIRRPGDVAVSF
jgi:hypothetical protein